MVLYKKKYRVETNRYSSHAYKEGMYFVTICTKKKMQWFGEVRDGKMILSEVGKITLKNLIEIPKHFTGAKILSHVLMPNHIHLILSLPTVETRESRVSTKEASPQNELGKKFILNSKTLGSIINQLKGTVTKHVWAAGFSEFQWQPRYHDHIIRSEKELSAIRQYIASNPNTWDKETIPWHADATSWSL